MTPYDPTMNPEFYQFVILQLRRHRLFVAGNTDDPDADEIEDQMTVLWEKLDETQHQSVRGMSSDLNWIGRNGGTAPKGRQPGDVTHEDMLALLKSRSENEWHAVLHYLRLCTGAISPINLAYLRGQAYGAIALEGYSSAFYDQAVKFEPGNASMWVLAIRAANREDPYKAHERAEHMLESPLTFPPVAVAMSAATTLRRLAEQGAKIDNARYTKILQETLDRLKLELPIASVRAMVFQLAASAFEIIDDLPRALRCYEEGLRLSPENEVLHVGMGLLLYGSQTERAVQAFLNAVQKQTRLVWPYFFLAHYYVRDRQYDTSLEMGRLAWARAVTDAVRAELLEWQAISLYELNYPVEVVRSIFDKATALDPGNTSIQTNVAAFANVSSNARRVVWEIEKEHTLRVEMAPSVSELELVSVP